ncbi:MAG: beta-galactosidase [Candidatus Kerfeldbacteria bacterium]|nr:beta-galactosidase [Candidatus Kerfeldbacteria bacterium]
MPIKDKIIIISVLIWCIPNIGLARGDMIKGAFGMNIHLRQRVVENDWSTVMALAAEAGVQWGREQFNWDVLEPTDNNYSFTTYDAVITQYQANNIIPVGLLTYSSAWASTNAGAPDYEFYPPNVVAWQDYVSTVAEHYAGQVEYWEIWNEPNYSGFWNGTVAEYANILHVAADAIHQVNPNAKVILGGLSGTDSDYLEAVYAELADDNVIDIVAVHPYRVVDGNYNYTPEEVINGLNSLTVDLYNIKAVLQRHHQAAIPIWLTEMGWTTATAGISEQRQAEYLMRLYSLALAIPNVRKVFWYSFNDTSSTEEYIDAQFGLLNHLYEPKTSYSAYQFVQQHLNRHYFKDQLLPQYRIIDNFIHNLGWRFAGTVCTDGVLNITNRSTLQVSYRFTNTTNCYAPVTLGKSLSTHTRVVQFLAKGDASATVLRLRVIDASGETFQYNLGQLPDEWLYYTVQLNNPSSHWSGNNDGKLDRPVQFDSFVLDNRDGATGSGTVYFDELYAGPIANTYLYRYHANKKDTYAYWTTQHTIYPLLTLPSAGHIREQRWQQSHHDYRSGNGQYRLRAKREVKFLQTF